MNRQKEMQVTAYVRLIRTAEALHGAISRGLLIEGLTASQFATLKVLRLYGSVSQRDIAGHLVKSGGNITVVVDNLEKMKLVERVRDTQDRRIVFVSLTPQGRELFDRIYPGHLDRITTAMSKLSDDECDRFIKLLDTLNEDPTEVVCVSDKILASVPSEV